MRKGRKGVVVAYVGLGLCLLPFPLIGILHVEAAAVIAAAGFLISALVTVKGRLPHPNEWAKLVFAAFIPAVLLLISLAWRPNCGWPLGLFLYTLFVVPSVLLGAGLGAAVREAMPRYRTLVVVGVWLFLLVVPTLAVLKQHPQLFVYNPVFGGVFGPIYDDELSIRAGFFWHRLRTLLWVGWLVLFARWRSGGSWQFRNTIVTVVVTGALGLLYLFQVPLGIVQTEERIARTLGATYRSASLAVHYDSLSLSRQDAALLAREQEYRLERVATTLDLGEHRLDEPIHVFIYPDKDTKGALIGARRTSVAPVWLAIPQVHVLQSQVRSSLTHELVHVAARSFGRRWSGASWSVGLVEGLAAALEPPQGYPALETQIVAASRLSEGSPGRLEDPARVASGMMAPWRFWTSRPAMAYAVSGAFTAYLLDVYGAEALKRSYRTGAFGDVYGTSLDSLAAEWDAGLGDTPADSATAAWVQWLFSQPSVFELRCPHHVPMWVRRAREAEDLQSAGMFRRALSILGDIREERPNDPNLTSRWARAALASGVAPDSVTNVLDAFPDSLSTATFLMRKGDARRMAGGSDASEAYERAIEESSPFPATARAFVRLRSRLEAEALQAVLQVTDDDSTQVARARELERWPEAAVFSAAFYASAGRYGEAWRTASPASLEDLPRDEQRAVTLHMLEWAIAAGALEEAERIAVQMATEGSPSEDPLAILADDRLGYIRWLRETP